VNKRNIAIVGAVVFVGLIGIGAAAGGTSSADGATPSAETSQPAGSTAPVAETTPIASAPAATTPAADPGSGLMVGLNEPTKVGDVTVTVLDAKVDPKGTQYQKPAKGHVFFAMKVRYEAADREALISMSDWKVLADDKQQGKWTIVMNDDWDPALTFESLGSGAISEGWITFEVPTPKAEIVARFDNDFLSDDAQFSFVKPVK